MPKMTKIANESTRRLWSPPTLRQVIPARRTRGGASPWPANGQDDPFYDIS